MSSKKIMRAYVSEIDQFLTRFDQQHPALSSSQQKEKAKYRRIYQLRDDPLCTELPSPAWDSF